MVAQPLQGVLHTLRKSLFDGTSADAVLVRSFVAGNDQAAFALLVKRHGPMVYGVCRRILGNVHDAEDAFQATFIVLARKAASVQPPELVGNWLYGVANRTALEARSRVMRKNAREKQVAELPHPAVETNAEAADVKQWIDRELSRLPDKYRAAVVLCELEGRSRKEVAEMLKVAEGTLSSRLAAARKILADRLRARGLAATSALIGTLFTEFAAQAASPASAAAVGAGASAATSHATILAEFVMKAMFLAKIKSLALNTITVCVIALGIAGAAGYAVGAFDAGEQPPAQGDRNTNKNKKTETIQENNQGGAKAQKAAAFKGIHIKQGTVAIRQTGRENLGEARDDLRVENGILIIDGGNPSVEFAIEVNELQSLTVDGVGKVTAADLKGKSLNVVVTRPATVVLSGAVEDQNIRVAAGATLDAQACKGKTGIVNVPAGGRAIVNISDKLDATVSAGGTLSYLGTPKITDKVSPGGTLSAFDGEPAAPKIEFPAKEPVGKKPTEQPKEAPALKGAIVFSAAVDGYTQATMFNTQKYPFKYTAASALDGEQLKSLSKAGDVPAATVKAMFACLLSPKENDSLKTASLKSDGKKLVGDVEVQRKIGKQGTHVLKLKLDGAVDAGQVTLRVVSAAVSGTWDYGGGVIKLIGDVKVTITAK